MKKAPTGKMIEDAASFYTAIKANPLYSDVEDQEVIEALDQTFGDRYRAANEDSRGGIGRDKYFYFQGLLGGMYIGWKQWKTHLEASAMNASIDPSTGRKINFKGEN